MTTDDTTLGLHMDIFPTANIIIPFARSGAVFAPSTALVTIPEVNVLPSPCSTNCKNSKAACSLATAEPNFRESKRGVRKDCRTPLAVKDFGTSTGFDLKGWEKC